MGPSRLAGEAGLRLAEAGEISLKANPQLVGRTAEDWIVVFNGPVSLAGEFARVKITRTSPLTLFGEI